MAVNKIGRTIKVDRTTLMASKGKFARVCIEVDLTKSLKAGYRFRGEMLGYCMSGYTIFASTAINMATSQLYAQRKTQCN